MMCSLLIFHLLLLFLYFTAVHLAFPSPTRTFESHNITLSSSTSSQQHDIMFIDTPGIPKHRDLSCPMLTSVAHVVWVLDSTDEMSITANTAEMMQLITLIPKAKHIPCTIVAMKSDHPSALALETIQQQLQLSVCLPHLPAHQLLYQCSTTNLKELDHLIQHFHYLFTPSLHPTSPLLISPVPSSSPMFLRRSPSAASSDTSSHRALLISSVSAEMSPEPVVLTNSYKAAGNSSALFVSSTSALNCDTVQPIRIAAA